MLRESTGGLKSMASGGCEARLVWDTGMMQYDFGPHHPLRPERFTYGLDLLRAADLLETEERLVHPRPASRAELELIHEPDYIETLERLDSGETLPPEMIARHGLAAGDNPWFPGAHESSSLIAGGSLQATQQIMVGAFQHAFNCGGGLHHAMPGRAAGFCVYNDPALAIAWLLKEHDARVLYLDFDAHHGDGVQAMFYDEPRVLTYSIHESGRYLFPGTGEVTELGAGAGYGYSVNTPMEPFTQDDSWLATVRLLVPELAETFQPDFIVSQHGCDGHAWDPLTHLGITTRAVAEQARLTHELAHRYCEGRWLATGGGGYDFRRVVPRMYALVFADMSGRALPPETPAAWRERWGTTAPEPLPRLYLDPEEEFPPTARAADIRSRNAQTASRAREAVLPILQQRGKAR
jgi:acetoin utilization protein AcuC